MVEQILETGAQQVDDQDIVEALLAEIVDIGNAGCETSVRSFQACYVREMVEQKNGSGLGRAYGLTAPLRRVGKRTKVGLTAADEDLVCAVLVPQLGRIALPGLELDGDLLLVQQVGALEDDTEGALANLLPDAVVDADDVGRRRSGSHCLQGCGDMADGVDDVMLDGENEDGRGRRT
jgi:hypothetical protein